MNTEYVLISIYLSSFHDFKIMDLVNLCAQLGDFHPDHLHVGFASLLDLYPESSCESIQLVNVLIPLALDAIRPFFTEQAMIQVNCYFYAEVSGSWLYFCLNLIFSLLVELLILSSLIL